MNDSDQALAGRSLFYLTLGAVNRTMPPIPLSEWNFKLKPLLSLGNSYL